MLVRDEDDTVRVVSFLVVVVVVVVIFVVDFLSAFVVALRPSGKSTVVDDETVVLVFFGCLSLINSKKDRIGRQRKG